jgi:CheY-like chemotaxis protein
MQSLYEPFDRLGAETTGVEGTGLGLALSKRLVEVMGGQIGVTSAADEGTAFSIEFPIAEAPQGVAIDLQLAPSLPQSGISQTILYIEDNLSNLKLIERLLERRGGVQLLTAVDSKRGLELAREYLPDVILLDLHLPDMSGEQALREIRRDPRTCEIPVVIVSADATSSQKKRLLKAGADDYLTKPLNIERFGRMLDERLKEAVA